MTLKPSLSTQSSRRHVVCLLLQLRLSQPCGLEVHYLIDAQVENRTVELSLVSANRLQPQPNGTLCDLHLTTTGVHLASLFTKMGFHALGCTSHRMPCSPARNTLGYLINQRVHFIQYEASLDTQRSSYVQHAIDIVRVSGGIPALAHPNDSGSTRQLVDRHRGRPLGVRA